MTSCANISPTICCFLQRIVGKIEGINLPKVSPFAVPVMMEIGREAIAGAAQEAILEAAAFDLISEALS
jgi:ATP-dependent helicase Lhr and Lhr-like helicase